LRKTLLRQIILSRIRLHGEIIRGAFPEVASRNTVDGFIADGSSAKDPLRQRADNGDEDDDGEVGGDLAVVVGEVEA